MPTILFIFNFHSFFACYNLNRFVASVLFCVRLQLNSHIVVDIYFDGAEIKKITILLYTNYSPEADIDKNVKQLDYQIGHFIKNYKLIVYCNCQTKICYQKLVKILNKI